MHTSHSALLMVAMKLATQIINSINVYVHTTCMYEVVLKCQICLTLLDELLFSSASNDIIQITI